jgi:hypothetical protein
MTRSFQFWTGSGPSAVIHEAEARAQLARGWLRPDTPCLVPGATAWQPFAVVAPDLFAPATQAPATPPYAPQGAAYARRGSPRLLLALVVVAVLLVAGLVTVVVVASRSSSTRARGGQAGVATSEATDRSPGAPRGPALESGTGVLDLAAGGRVAVAGVAVETRPGAGAGALSLTVATYEAMGTTSGEATVVSAEVEVQLPPGAALPSGGFLVSIPVTLPPPEPAADAEAIADDPQLGIETFDEATASWREIEARLSYDAERGVVEFQVPHFSRYRVIFRHRVLRMWNTQIETPDGHFRISYYQPRMELRHLTENQRRNVVPTDEEWQALGGAPDDDRDPDVPDAVEDVASAAEEMLKQLTTITDSSATRLFSADVFPLEIRLVYVSGNDPGDTSLGGPVRLNLKAIRGWNDLRLIVAHELVHVLQDQHYTSVGALWNTWFVDASANLWAARADRLGTAASQSYWFDGIGDYLRVSLDAGTAGSRYAAADLLAFLEKKTGKAVAADVLTSGANTLGDLGTLVAAAGGAPVFERLFVDYVRTTVATSPAVQGIPGLWGRIELTDSSPTATFTEWMAGTTVRAFDLETSIAADCLLAIIGTGAVKSVTWKSAGLPIPDPDVFVEDGVSLPAAFAIPHVGRRGTPGTELFRLQHLVINPGTDSAQAGLAYYLLVPPRLSDDRTTGRVSWEWVDPGHPVSAASLIKGFNVYAAGNRVNPALIDATERTFSSPAIGWPPPGQDAGVVVTVVDHAGNEWPVPPSASFDPAGEWTGEFTADRHGGDPGTTIPIPSGTREPVRVTFQLPGTDGKIAADFAFVFTNLPNAPPRVEWHLRPSFTRNGLRLVGELMEPPGEDQDRWHIVGDARPSGSGWLIEGTWREEFSATYPGPDGNPITESGTAEGTWRATRTTR